MRIQLLDGSVHWLDLCQRPASQLSEREESILGPSDFHQDSYDEHFPQLEKGINSKQLKQKDVYYRLNKYKKLYVFYIHRQGSTVGKTYSSRATKSSTKYVYKLECCKVRVWLRQARTLHLARSPRTQEKYWIWHQVFLGNLVSNSVWGNFFLPKLPYI